VKLRIAVRASALIYTPTRKRGDNINITNNLSGRGVWKTRNCRRGWSILHTLKILGGRQKTKITNFFCSEDIIESKWANLLVRQGVLLINRNRGRKILI
jgi:hypothetical protein